jgi:2-polyprenyl-3-methyl-5-hydroxy-6-metoxy-1,4-benzoquinol methylase
MDPLLRQIIAQIDLRNPVHAKKLKKNLDGAGDEYFARAALFLNRYEKFTRGIGKNLDYGIECYLRVVADVMHEQMRFITTGEYSSKSFEDVQRRVYDNPGVMEYYMHGLMLSHFLWLHHYKVLSFFIRTLPRYRGRVSNYLEIGGGHGLYISEALEVLSNGVSFEVLDISESSLAMARQFVDDRKVCFILGDIYSFEPGKRYDFITMGEVLEHVENPLGLLVRLHDLLSNQGHLFITAPTNAPAIDHIYLFRSVEEIRGVIRAAGLEIVDEISLCAEAVSLEKAERLKLTVIYGAFLKKAS